MNTNESINSLELMSKEFEKAANKPDNYNSEMSYYLEQMSWSLHKHANDLREIQYLFGVTQHTNTNESQNLRH